MLDTNFIGPVFRGRQHTALSRVQTITPYLMPKQSAYPDRQECRTALHDQCGLALHLTLARDVTLWLAPAGPTTPAGSPLRSSAPLTVMGLTRSDPASRRGCL